MHSSAHNDMKYIMSMVMSGGPNGVAEQRIMQLKLSNVMKTIKAAETNDDEALTKLTREHRQIVENLDEKYGLVTGEIKRLKGKLIAANLKVTNLTKRLEKQDGKTSQKPKSDRHGDSTGT